MSRPENSGNLAWRPATASDIDAIYGLFRAMDPVDHPDYTSTRDEIAEDFAHSYIDAQSDTLLAEDANGRVVAYGIVIQTPGQDDLVRSILVGGVHPTLRGTGIGRQLFGWQHDRGLQQLATSDKRLPGRLVAFAEEHATTAHRLFERFGFTVARYFLTLTRDLGEPIAPRPLDAELRLVQFAPEWSEATRLARNDAFRDHWGSQPVTDEQWQSLIDRSVTRRDLSFLAIGANQAGEQEVAGLVVASVNEDDWAAAGYSNAYIDLVGVRRNWRGRGVAAALLTESMRAIAAEGMERAVLDVDSDSPTGALGLYQGVGFVEANRSFSFARDF